jgi:hypothetical protein
MLRGNAGVPARQYKSAGRAGSGPAKHGMALTTG